MDQAKKVAISQITLCGGGNLTHNSIASIGHHNPGIKINLLTRRPKDWDTQIVSKTDASPWKDKGPLTGKLHKVSDNPADVVPGSQAIIIAGPACAHYEILKRCAPFVEKGAFVGTVFGQGGFDLQARSAFGEEELVKRQIVVFGLKHVPYLCKAIKYGHEAKIIGVKTFLYAACFPLSAANDVAAVCEQLWSIKTKISPNFLTLTLTPSNQIIHPGRTYGFWKDWDGETPIDPGTIPFLYDGMDQFSADEIEKLDKEMTEIVNALRVRLPTVDLSMCLGLRERVALDYGEQVGDPSTMLSVFNTNKGYAGVAFPVLPKGKGVVLNTGCRFFTEDIPFGLIILKTLADFTGVKVPNIERQILWHQKFMKEKYMKEDGTLVEEAIHLSGSPLRYGIKSVEDLIPSNSGKVPKL